MKPNQDYDLTEAEMAALANGDSPASIGIIDYEDLIHWLACSLVDTQRRLDQAEQEIADLTEIGDDY